LATSIARAVTFLGRRGFCARPRQRFLASSACWLFAPGYPALRPTIYSLKTTLHWTAGCSGEGLSFVPGRAKRIPMAAAWRAMELNTSIYVDARVSYQGQWRYHPRNAFTGLMSRTRLPFPKRSSSGFARPRGHGYESVFSLHFTAVFQAPPNEVLCR